MLGLNLEETRVYREAEEQGERKLVLRLLNRRVGEIPEPLKTQIKALSREQLEALGEALLDFSTLADLQGWLQSQARG